MSKNVGRSRVGYSGRKPRAQGTEMGVKQSVGRSCDCFQDTKTAEKTHFLNSSFADFFTQFHFMAFSQIWLFCAQKRFGQKTWYFYFLEGR